MVHIWPRLASGLPSDAPWPPLEWRHARPAGTRGRRGPPPPGQRLGWSHAKSRASPSGIAGLRVPGGGLRRSNAFTALECVLERKSEARGTPKKMSVMVIHWNHEEASITFHCLASSPGI